MALAVANYAYDYDTALPTVGFSHGGETFAEQGAWFFVLKPYSDSQLLYRCPSDDSPHWDTPDSNSRLRRVSYATNFMLTGQISGPASIFNRLDTIPRPSRTAYIAELAEVSGSGFATADHFHPETWFGSPAFHDMTIRPQLEIDQHQGRYANYAFLDGHAEAAERKDVFEVDPAATFANKLWIRNAFWPTVAK